MMPAGTAKMSEMMLSTTKAAKTAVATKEQEKSSISNSFFPIDKDFSFFFLDLPNLCRLLHVHDRL
jgi:hypothetical protein